MKIDPQLIIRYILRRLNTTTATLIGVFTLIAMSCGAGSYYERVNSEKEISELKNKQTLEIIELRSKQTLEIIELHKKISLLEIAYEKAKK